MDVLLASAGLALRGGIASVSRSLAGAIGTAKRRGTLRWTGLLEFHDSFNGAHDFDWRATARSRRLSFVAQLARTAASRPGTVVVFDTIGLARAVRLIPAPMRPKYVVVAHGREISEIHTRRGAAEAVRAASLLVTVSPTSRRLLSEELGHALPRMRVIAPCIELSRIELWSDVRPHAAASNPTVLTVGRMSTEEPGKGHDTLIRALQRVTERVPDARLVVVGEGNSRAILEQLARDFGVQSRVHFVGYVSDADLGRLYREAWVFALPSRQEGFGIVYAEAMWHGLACIGSTADAAVDTIVPGSTGCLVEYGNVEQTAEVLTWLLDSPHIARKLGAAGRAVCAERYTPDVFGSEWIDALASLDRQAAPGSPR